MGRLHHRGSEGLRQEQADVDHRRERTDDHDPDASRSAVDHRAVQGRRTRQHPAAAPIRFTRSGLDRSAERHRRNLQHNYGNAADLECVDERRWDPGA